MSGHGLEVRPAELTDAAARDHFCKRENGTPFTAGDRRATVDTMYATGCVVGERKDAVLKLQFLEQNYSRGRAEPSLQVYGAAYSNRSDNT